MKILIVEDDKILAKTIEQCISPQYDTDIAYDGEEGLMYAKQGIYDLILLDLMLPIMNGYEVLRTLRNKKNYTPVLILTAKDGLDDKLRGFDDGADDYITKPFERKELLARIEAILRRSKGAYTEKNTIIFKDLVLDLNNREVKVNGEELALQGKQFDVLEYLLSETSTNVIEVYASGLRKELKKIGYDKYLKTIRGVGYIWNDK